MARFSKLLRYALYASVFLGAFVCSLYLTSTWIIQSGQEVVVPDLQGHDTVYALDLLTSLGLNIKVGGFTWSETVPKNFIASQEPAPGTRCKRDRDVRVVLSRGSRTVRVPKLVGSGLREAELVLSQNGLKVGEICHVFSKDDPPDTVIAQRPEALRQLERGEGVDLLVSDVSERPATAMPELRHRAVGQALKLLDRLGLGVSEVKVTHRPDKPLDTIVGQRPLAGYRVDPESSIALVVNRSPRFKGRQAKLWWVTYVVPEGYFKKEVTLCQRLDGKRMLLHRKIHCPGDQLEWLVWAESLEQIRILVDGQVQGPVCAGFCTEGTETVEGFSGGHTIGPLFEEQWRAP
ncbi:MAG: PASTA domain-containing protein [Syntrophobacteria bacterium]